jgi:hypothetical protein
MWCSDSEDENESVAIRRPIIYGGECIIGRSSEVLAITGCFVLTSAKMEELGMTGPFCTGKSKNIRLCEEKVFKSTTIC